MALKPKPVLDSHHRKIKTLRMQGKLKFKMIMLLKQLQMVRDPKLSKKEIQEKVLHNSQGRLISRVKNHTGQRKDLRMATLRVAGTLTVRIRTNLRMSLKTMLRMISRMRRRLTFQPLEALKIKFKRLRSQIVLGRDQ